MPFLYNQLSKLLASSIFTDFASFYFYLFLSLSNTSFLMILTLPG